ncbi:MAG: Fe-S protein assembly co-chaperone HscB [Alphaproteobacteria bacterium]|nr:Fe-S protein assembly co-chaperone HscB [Alphaproteobacteria bacterium]
MNYFSILELPAIFSLDPAALESAYFAAQRQFHPDRYAAKPEPERLKAAQASADANKAYRVLKDPLSRAQHLLELEGVVVGTDHDSIKPSQALLMEVMELRETPPDAKTLDKLRGESITRIASYFEAKRWPEMAEETLRLGYLMKAHHATATDS